MVRKSAKLVRIIQPTFVFNCNYTKAMVMSMLFMTGDLVHMETLLDTLVPAWTKGSVNQPSIGLERFDECHASRLQAGRISAAVLSDMHAAGDFVLPQGILDPGNGVIDTSIEAKEQHATVRSEPSPDMRFAGEPASLLLCLE